MKTKKDKAYSYEHTKERALERYGIELTPEIYERWNKLCTYDTRIQMDVNNKQQVHIIEWEGKHLTVVKSFSRFSSEEEYIKTVLPEGTKLMFGKDTANLDHLTRTQDWYKKRGSK